MGRSASEQDRRDGHQPEDGAGAHTGIGTPSAAEHRQLKAGGLLLAVSDLLWIPQAGLIALALGTTLTRLHAVPQGGADASVPMNLVLLLAAGFVMLAAGRAGLQYVGAELARRAARQVQRRARTELLATAAKTSPAAPFPSSGEFAAQLTEQVDLLGPYCRNYLPQVPRLKIVPLVIVLVTAWHSWLAALILLICGPVIPLFMALIGMKAKAASAAQQEELTRLSGMLLDRIRGLETLELFGALERTRRDIAEAGDRFRKGTMAVLRIAFLSSTVLELFSALGIAFAAVYVGFSLLGDITVGTWGAPFSYTSGLFVLLLAPEFFAPLRAYAAAYHDRAAGLAAQEKLSRLLKECRQDKSLHAAVRPGGETSACGLLDAPSISVEALTLDLSGTRVFEDFDLEISPGETVFLTGASGSGKTSLLDCLLGFHVPRSGKVRIDGRDPRNLGRTLLQNVCWLDQAPRLFHGSLRANLLKGAVHPHTVADTALWRALSVAGARELVERLPQGLSTQLGEDGFGLSVGEIRRIALARAAMRQDAGLFLADEPTAALDETTAANVIQGLAHLAAGRTTVIATHDPAVLALPGRVIDLGRKTGACLEEMPQ